MPKKEKDRTAISDAKSQHRFKATPQPSSLPSSEKSTQKQVSDLTSQVEQCLVPGFIITNDHAEELSELEKFGCIVSSLCQHSIVI